jgi:hypothetical protein
MDEKHEAYVRALEALKATYSDEAWAICRAWNGDTFGKPGYGSAEWVIGELYHAEVAIKVLRGITG